MPLYRSVEGKMEQIRSRPLPKEKDLQRMIEPNLVDLLGIHFLETEYNTTSGGRIDTLGVDVNGAPIIIEYKRNQNDNVINQALSYRKWLTGQKPEFFQMLVNKRLPEDIANRIKLDWTHPRIICIAEKFSRFDVDTADVLSAVFRVELITYRAYEGDIFHLEPLTTPGERKSEPAPTESTELEPMGGSIGYSVEFHRSRGSVEVQEVFDELRSRILALGPEVVERPVQAYIGYRTSKNFAEVQIQRARVKLFLRGIADDPQGRASRVPDARGWTLNYEIGLNTASDLDYSMGLVEQSYNDVT